MKALQGSGGRFDYLSNKVPTTFPSLVECVHRVRADDSVADSGRREEAAPIVLTAQ